MYCSCYSGTMGVTAEQGQQQLVNIGLLRVEHNVHAQGSGRAPLNGHH
jgi:hypothetical protein